MRLQVPFRVSIVGAPPGSSGGTDIDENGSGLLDEQWMYQLIRRQARSATARSRSNPSIAGRKHSRSVDRSVEDWTSDG